MMANVEPTSVTDIPPAMPSWVSLVCAAPPRVVPSNEIPIGPIVMVSPLNISVEQVNPDRR